MAPLVLYHTPISPFSRSVLLLTRFLDIDVDVKVLDLLEKKEQLEEWFVKINPQVTKLFLSVSKPALCATETTKTKPNILPQHCVPTIDDDGFILWESRSILAYLMETRAAHLLPTSPKEKAILNQRLQFELGGLTDKMRSLFVR